MKVLFAFWDCFVKRKGGEACQLPGLQILGSGHTGGDEAYFLTVLLRSLSRTYTCTASREPCSSKSEVQAISFCMFNGKGEEALSIDAQPWQQLTQIKSSVSSGKLPRPQTKVFYSHSLFALLLLAGGQEGREGDDLSLIHISEPTRPKR